MKKSIIKKLFIKLAKIIGFEIIDQNNFISPTLNKELNEDLSEIGKKSINYQWPFFLSHHSSIP